MNYTLKTTISGDMATGGALITAPFTPAPGALLVAILTGLNPAGQTAQTSIADSVGLTWTLQKRESHADSGGWSSTVDIFTAKALANTPMTIAADWHQQTLHAAGGRTITVIEFLGYLDSAPVAQMFGTGGSTGRTGPLNVNLAAAPALTSYVISAATGNINGTAADLTPLTGFTQIDENIQTFYGANSSYRAVSTSPAIGMDNFDMTGSPFSWSFVSIEVAAAPVSSSDSVDLEMQGYIVNALRSDAGVLALLGGPRVYDRVPENPDFPYITYGPSQANNIYPDCIDGADLNVQIDAWSREVGYPEVKRISQAVHAALHDKEVSLPVNACCYLNHTQTLFLRDPDGLTNHAVMIFDAFVERRVAP